MLRLSTFALLALATGAQAQVTHTLVATDFIFTPETLSVATGDTIHLILTGPDHTCTQVSEATWSVNGTTPNGGFNFGPGTPNPGNEFKFVLDPAVYYYVCVPHADMAMKGIIEVGQTGIGEQSNAADFLLFPNPATSEVRVMPPTSLHQMFVLLYDAHGRNVMSTDLRQGTILDIDWLDPGVYTVVSMNENGLPIARKQLVIIDPQL